MCSNSGCKELIFGVCLQFVGPVKCFPAEHARTHKSIERHFLQSTVSETQGDLAESLWCSLKKISFPTNINMKLKICVPPSKRSSHYSRIPSQDKKRQFQYCLREARRSRWISLMLVEKKFLSNKYKYEIKNLCTPLKEKFSLPISTRDSLCLLHSELN